MKLDRSLGEKVWARCGGSEGVRRHKVEALLHSLHPEKIPESFRADFETAFRRTLAENMLYLMETRQVLCLLAGQMKVLPLKGVLFASRFYPDIGCRPQSDVDVLVREEDLERAHVLLLSAGWKEAVPRGFYVGHYHWVYEKGEGGPLLELHWGFNFPGTSVPNLERIWSQVREAEVEGLRFLDIRTEDLLQYMAVNKAMQHFPALLDFVDLHFIVERSAIDWEIVLKNAAADRTAGALWFGLAHCKELLGTRVPEGVLRSLAGQPSAAGARLLNRIVGWMGGASNVSPALLEGPVGRIYEAFLQGRPRAAAGLLKPLMIPSKERVALLGQGSYFKYVWRNAAHAGNQAGKTISIMSQAAFSNRRLRRQAKREDA